MALRGKFDSNEVFLGLVEAMVQKADREERGVGMQNFHYTPAFDEFVHVVSIESKAAHRQLDRHFKVRGLRSIRFV